MADTKTKTKCIGCGKERGHVPGCAYIPCDKCGIAAALGHLENCPDNVNGEAPAETVIRVTVDGHDADFKKSSPEADEPEEEPLPKYPEIALVDGALEAFQIMLNSGDFSGDKQLKERCDFEHPEFGKCPNIAAMAKVIKTKCPECEHSSKETTERFCIGHLINVYGGNVPARLQTEMAFE